MPCPLEMIHIVMILNVLNLLSREHVNITAEVHTAFSVEILFYFIFNFSTAVDNVILGSGVQHD